MRVTAPVQNVLEGLFVQQRNSLLAGITEEIDFDGGWKPESNEILKVPATGEVSAIYNTAIGDPLALNEIPPHNFESHPIKAIGVVAPLNGTQQFLLQNFDSRQVLSRHFSLISDGNTFNQLSEPGFSLANSITAIVTSDSVKFRSFSNVRKIFNIKHLYIEATDAQIDDFCSHDSIHAGIDQIKGIADQQIRKLIHAISHRGTLNQFSTQQICQAADNEGLTVTIHNSKIVLPSEKGDLKKVLAFLDDGYFRAALTGVKYITNSKRVAPM
ncbi:Kiwa anti-phage protein KwaB-like domain-containing protein [Paradevosia shaoguanensis]|uniref:DUF4868 domain-containing protein n=1 Tax=Paradevosia shaoguanensis TaxID=1335043 RepID=A0AA41QNF3_9HYPH|nr:DUF4868 domain-containing protein [Paradevosia shaoguanensis]MCI0127760.1 DUF4868 domain-containing protein [Paradevosia shaoguanensis]